MAWAAKARSTGLPAAAAAAAPGVPTASELARKLLLYLLVHLRGSVVVAQLIDGTSWEGVFSNLNLEGERKLTLRAAQLLQSDQQSPGSSGMSPRSPTRNLNPFIDTKVIPLDQVVQFRAARVAMGSQEDASARRAGTTAPGFQTDTQISAHSGIQERELQKWQPDDVQPRNAFQGLSLDEEASLLSKQRKGESIGWDQFQQPGVKPTTFSMKHYTTEIDRSDPQYARHAQLADRIAREIMSETATNVHIAEERGQLTPGAEALDEEMRYSTVQRTGEPLQQQGQGGRYVVPQRRATGGPPGPSGATAGNGTGAAVGHAPRPATASANQSPRSNEPARPPRPGPASSTPPGGASASAPVPTAPPKPKSTLNPMAKEFKLNASAPEFVPSFELDKASLPSPAHLPASPPGPATPQAQAPTGPPQPLPPRGGPIQSPHQHQHQPEIAPTLAAAPYPVLLPAHLHAAPSPAPAPLVMAHQHQHQHQPPHQAQPVAIMHQGPLPHPHTHAYFYHPGMAPHLHPPAWMQHRPQPGLSLVAGAAPHGILPSPYYQDQVHAQPAAPPAARGIPQQGQGQGQAQVEEERAKARALAAALNTAS